MLDTVKNDDDDDFVRHDTCFFQKLFIALLDSFNGRFEHVFGLTVDTYTDGQFYSSLFGSSKE